MKRREKKGTCFFEYHHFSFLFFFSVAHVCVFFSYSLLLARPPYLHLPSPSWTFHRRKKNPIALFCQRGFIFTYESESYNAFLFSSFFVMYLIYKPNKIYIIVTKRIHTDKNSFFLSVSWLFRTLHLYD
jgi:hypothetical protein